MRAAEKKDENKQENLGSFSVLPVETREKIFSYLTVKELACLLFTSKDFEQSVAPSFVYELSDKISNKMNEITKSAESVRDKSASEPQKDKTSSLSCVLFSKGKSIISVGIPQKQNEEDKKFLSQRDKGPSS